MTDLTGKRLAHFEIVGPLGAGGMAAVWRATDLNLGRSVALKILPHELAADPEHRARFRQEAKAAARLDHDNIARVYFCGEDDGVHFIAFEYVDGQDLRVMLQRRGRLPAAEAVGYLAQVARGLAQAAACGVVHRDIKPANVVITPAGQAKIVDMGLARLDGPVDQLTRSGVTLGTFDYISPEQAIEPRAVDARSDLYSLGCTFYHALTGQPPAPEGTAAQKLHYHQHVRPTDPQLLAPDLPDNLVAVLARLMAKDPGDRFVSADELLNSLAPLLNQSTPQRIVFAAAQKTPVAAILATVAALLAIVVGQEFLRPAANTSVDAVPRAPSAVAELGDGAGDNGARAPESDGVDAATVEELQALLANQQAHIRLTGGSYDLPNRDGTGLLFTGRKLILTAADPYRPPILRLLRGTVGPASVLAIRGSDRAHVTLRGLVLTAEHAEADAPVTLLSLGGVERCTIDLCTFDARPLATVGALTGIAISGDKKATPIISVTASAFIRGGSGIRLTGPGQLSLGNCSAIGLQNLVTARDTGGPSETIVRLDQCTALLDGGSAFRFEDGAGGSLQAGHCLFAGPHELTSATRSMGPTLVRQTGRGRGEVEFRNLFGRDGVAHRNGYAGLGSWWVDDSDDRTVNARTPEDCARMRYTWLDADPLEFARPPFRAEHPLELVSVDPMGAVALESAWPELRVERGGTTQNLGAQLGPWGRSAGGPAAPRATGLHRPKVVDPTRETNSGTGVYRILAQALPDARADDVILIKGNDTIAMAPLRFDRPDVRLTIAPFPGYRPTLTLAPSSDAQPVLFQVIEGAVTLRGLHLRLKPERGELRSQNVMTIAAGGSVHLTECTVTLEEIADVRLAVAATTDADGMPRAPGERRPIPVLRVDHCLIRGKGDFLAVGANRRFDCDVADTLIALDGSLAILESPGRDAGEPSLSVQLRRATVALGDRMVDAPAVAEPAPIIKLDTADTLIASLVAQPLVRLAGANDDANVRTRLIWSAGRNTQLAIGQVFATGFEPGSDRPAWSAEAARIKDFVRDPMNPPNLVRVRWSAVAGVSGLSRARPADFRAKLLDDARNPGAVIEAEIGAPLDKLPRAEDDEPPGNDE